MNFNLQAAFSGLQGMCGIVCCIGVVQSRTRKILVGAAIGHHQNAVAGGEKLGEFGGNHDDPLACRRQLSDKFYDL